MTNNKITHLRIHTEYDEGYQNGYLQGKFDGKMKALHEEPVCTCPLEPVAKLQKEEDKLWEELEDLYKKHTIKTISKLIEVNLEIEKLCNQ